MAFDYHAQKSVYDAFKRMVELYGAEPAMRFKEKTFSYSELDSKIDSCAQYLSSKIQKGDIVAVYLPRSMDIFIAYLSILKLGAIYVPFDSMLPSERLRYMYEASDAKFLLSNKNLAPDFSDSLLYIEDVEESKCDVSIEVSAKDICYMIFTSGSTGKPKASIVQHGNALNLVRAVSPLAEIGPSDNVLQSMSVSFDACSCEWMTALLNGACLCVLAEDELIPFKKLDQVIREKSIHFMLTTPSILNGLNEDGLESLRVIFCGGESMSERLILRFSEVV